MGIKFLKIDQEKYGYDVLALFQSFYPEHSWQLVFPGCREQIIKEAEEIGFFAELIFSEEENGKVSVSFFSEPGSPEEKRETKVYPGGLGADFKEGFGNWLYDTLAERTGRSLPWGTLNGVRPTKLAYQRIISGESDEAIREYYLKERRTSREKADLAIEIAKRESKILGDLHLEDGYSLYIGIPFCPTTCLYCSFTSYPIARFKKEVDLYLDALIKELKYVSVMMAGKKLDTVYIGGGTPTTLEPDQLERLLGSVEEHFDLSGLFEYTVEAGRADSITEDKLKVLKAHGITRISINPQTFNQETLDFIGRKATVAQLLEVWPMARSLGFDNINMDIILGLPGEGREQVEKTMEKVMELKPDSLTVHSLAIKRASRLAQWIIQNGKETLKSSDDVMEIAASGARQLGLVPYYLYRQKNMSGNLENVGFSKPDKYGIYNILIMEEVQSIVAVGAGTVSKRVFYEDGRIEKLERCENVKEVPMYCEKIEDMLDRKRVLFYSNDMRV